MGQVHELEDYEFGKELKKFLGSLDDTIAKIDGLFAKTKLAFK